MEKSFGKWRQRFWPIYNIELKKFLPLFIMKFFISLNFGILTSLKDTLIVTADHSGAEVIPILKGGVVLPVAFLAALIYAKLVNHIRRTTLFYFIIFGFFSFFILYGYFLYPYSNLLSPTKSSDYLVSLLGAKYEYLIAIYRYWMHTLFFVASELWGSLVIFVLFWGYANDITAPKQASRFYSLLSGGGNLASIVAGPIIWFFTYKYAKFDFIPIQKSLLTLVSICCLIILFLYHKIEKSFEISKIQKISFNKTQKDKKTSLSLLEAIKHLSRSSYIRSLCFIVIGYGLTINLVEVTWKAHLKLYCPTPASYQYYMGIVSFWAGMVASISALFLGSNIMRKFGWKISASIPPFAVGVTGFIFLILVFFQNKLTFLTSLLSLSPLALIVIFGTAQNALSKGVKYSFFDFTKEMAFIPLDTEARVKGKAAIDVIGSRLGKSGASWLQIILIQLTSTGSILSATGYLIPLIFVVTFVWIQAIHKINLGHKELLDKQETLS